MRIVTSGMPALDDPSSIAQAIVVAMTSGPEPRPHWVRPRPGDKRPATARATGRPRITLVVAGERRVLAPMAGTPTELRLRPGDALIVGPDGWSMPIHGPQNRIIAINCHDHATQFDAPLPGNPRFLSGGPLNSAAWSLLTALVHLGEQPALHPLAPAVLRAAVTAALADCRPWPYADRSRMAWMRARARALEQPAISRDELAAAADVHPNHISRLCRRHEGTGLLTWLTGLRIQRACQLIESGWPIAEVIRSCGYAEDGHFRRCFRAKLGVAPSVWRRGLRSPDPAPND